MRLTSNRQSAQRGRETQKGKPPLFFDSNPRILTEIVYGTTTSTRAITLALSGIPRAGYHVCLFLSTQYSEFLGILSHNGILRP
jgi:hypothetical protein